VACQARQAGIRLTKEGHGFTHISAAASLAKIADTWSGQRTIGRLQQACERWIYTTCWCFALDLEEQQQSGFHYPYSHFYPVEYSRNLIFEIGGHREPVFQAWMERSRVLLHLKTSGPSWATSAARSTASEKVNLPHGKSRSRNLPRI
jgi:hypothetical protein